MQGSQRGGETTERGGRMEKTMRTRKKQKKNLPLEGTTGAVLLWEGGRRKLPYTTGAAHTTGEHCLVLCVDKPNRVLGPSPNCSCSWAVI